MPGVSIQHSENWNWSPSRLDSSDAIAQRSSANLSREETVVRKENAKAARLEGENSLRKIIAIWLLVLVTLQLVACNAIIGIILLYQLFKIGQPASDELILGWMSACLVEVLGIVWVMVRSLFPFRDKHRNHKAEKK